MMYKKLAPLVGTVFADLAGGGSHGSSSDQMVGAPDDPTWGHACRITREWGRRRDFTTKSDGMWKGKLWSVSTSQGSSANKEMQSFHEICKHSRSMPQGVWKFKEEAWR